MPHITQAPTGPGRDLTPFKYQIEGSFAPNGASSPVAASNDGAEGAWSVTRTAQGTWRIQLAFNVNRIMCVTASLQLAAAASRNVQIAAINQATCTVDVRVIDGAGVAQDVTADPNNRINFNITVRGTDRRRF